MWHMGQQRRVHTNFSRTLSIKRDILYDYRHGDTTCYLGFSAHQAENVRHNTELFFLFCFPASREKEIESVPGLRWRRVAAMADMELALPQIPSQRGGSGGNVGLLVFQNGVVDLVDVL